MNAASPLSKLGRRVRALRTAVGLTLEALAARAGMTAAALAAVEAGTADIDYLALRRIAGALGWPLADLLAVMDEEEEDTEDDEG
jgi:transcriptional regulator with XRE-family HTH domain